MLCCVLNIFNSPEAPWIFKNEMAHWQIVWAKPLSGNEPNTGTFQVLRMLSLKQELYYCGFLQQLFFGEHLYTRSSQLFSIHFFFPATDLKLWQAVVGCWPQSPSLPSLSKHVTYLCLNVSCLFRRSQYLVLRQRQHYVHQVLFHFSLPRNTEKVHFPAVSMTIVIDSFGQ